MRPTRILVVVATVATMLPVGPAVALETEVAAACPRSGGVAIPDATPKDGAVEIRGHGFGHGLGMSQYGANGAAALGCSHHRILAAYYPGAEQVTTGLGRSIDVGIVDQRHQTSRAAEVRVTNTGFPHGRRIDWAMTGCTDRRACRDAPRRMRAGEVWDVVTDAAGVTSIHKVVDGERAGAALWTGGDAGATLVLRHDGTVVDVRPVVGGTAVNQRQFRWGQLQITSTSTVRSGRATIDVVQRVTHRVTRNGRVISGLDRYLWGLGEVPSTFEMAAQRAQAVAARTYAARRLQAGIRSDCRCHVVTTMSDQHYAGWSKESADLLLGRRWRRAVLRTGGTVLTHEGRLIAALYSSSHGGHSAAPSTVWGGTDVAYLSPVDDSRWDVATDRTAWRNPYRSWSMTLSWRQLTQRLNASPDLPGAQYDRVTDISVPGDVSSLARAEGVTVTALRDRQVVTERWTTWEIRQALGLRSPNFVIESTPKE